MKRIKIIQLISTLILLISLSCSEEWLKPDPLSFFTPENVYVDPDGFESGLVRCKKEMNAENHGSGVHYIGSQFAYCDIAIGLFYLDATKLTPSTSYYPILTFFSNAYEYIKNANTIITRIDDIEWDDQSVRNRILAEALWFRSYWYYRLINDFGDVPWVGEELQGPKLDFYSTSREAILTKLKIDLEFAVNWLPDKPARLGDVSRGAANHLLAKIYLATCDFDKAVEATTAVINGPYALMTERFGIDKDNAYRNIMWDLHRCENKNVPENTETIYATVDRPDASPDTWWSNPGTNTMWLYVPEYWRVPDIEGKRACNWDTQDTLGLGNCLIRTNDFFHYALWEDETYTYDKTPDLRRITANWIEMGDSIADIYCNVVGSPNFGEPLNKNWGAIDTLISWMPWPYYKIFNPTPNYSRPQGGQGDYYIFRLAETYLLRAEAYYWLNQLGNAANDINKVRERANAPLISASDVTIEYIFDERARELYIEEPRHSEMVRVSFIFGKLNRNGYSLTNIQEKNWYHDRIMEVNHFYWPQSRIYRRGEPAILEPYHILWPIPQSVITANTMGRINQNIGYDGDHLNEPPLETIP